MSEHYKPDLIAHITEAIAAKEESRVQVLIAKLKEPRST
jgi:hypothetical protein